MDGMNVEVGTLEKPDDMFVASVIRYLSELAVEGALTWACEGVPAEDKLVSNPLYERVGCGHGDRDLVTHQDDPSKIARELWNQLQKVSIVALMRIPTGVDYAGYRQVGQTGLVLRVIVRYLIQRDQVGIAFGTWARIDSGRSGPSH